METKKKTSGWLAGTIGFYFLFFLALPRWIRRRPNLPSRSTTSSISPAPMPPSPSLRRKGARTIWPGLPTRGGSMWIWMGRGMLRSNTSGRNSAISTPGSCRPTRGFGWESRSRPIIEMWSSPNQEMMKPILEKDGIVCYGIGFSDPQLYPPAWNYMDCWSYGESAAGAIEYYIDNLWPKKGQGRKRPKWPT